MTIKTKNLFIISLIILLYTLHLTADYGDYSDYLAEEEDDDQEEILEEETVVDESTEEKSEETDIQKAVKKESQAVAETKIKEEVPETPAKSSDVKYVSAGVFANLTVPTGKADATWAVHGRLHYILPFWNPHLSFGVEAGYYTLKGKGTNLDPQAGLYDYSWRVDTMPLFIGFNVEYPVTAPILHLFAEAGFAAVFAWSEGSSFGGKSSAKDVAYGWYGGIGTEIRFGVFGGIVLQGRYTGMLLDFDFPQYNESPGDLGGISILLGYRNRF